MSSRCTDQVLDVYALRETWMDLFQVSPASLVHESRRRQLAASHHACVNFPDTRRPPSFRLQQKLRSFSCRRQVGSAADATAVCSPQSAIAVPNSACAVPRELAQLRHRQRPPRLPCLRFHSKQWSRCCFARRNWVSVYHALQQHVHVCTAAIRLADVLRHLRARSCAPLLERTQVHDDEPRTILERFELQISPRSVGPANPAKVQSSPPRAKQCHAVPNATSLAHASAPAPHSGPPFFHSAFR